MKAIIENWSTKNKQLFTAVVKQNNEKKIHYVIQADDKEYLIELVKEKYGEEIEIV